MGSGDGSQLSDHSDLLKQILSTVKSIQNDYGHLPAAVEAIQGQVNVLAGVKQFHDAMEKRQAAAPDPSPPTVFSFVNTRATGNSQDGPSSLRTDDFESNHDPPPRKHSTTTSRIILTTYPGQSGIDPLPMDWGNSNPLQRGPVVVSRSQSTIRRRNGT